MFLFGQQRPCGFAGGQGLQGIAVAAETLLDIRTMDFKGKDWQNVRTALNKAVKLGVTPLWLRYSELTTGRRTQVHEISEDWVSGQALPELGFTLGGLEELKDENVHLCLAIDAEGKIHAVTSWRPVHSDGVVVSWTLDFMRRNSGSFNGVMEYLVAQAVKHFAPLSTTSRSRARRWPAARTSKAAWGGSLPYWPARWNPCMDSPRWPTSSSVSSRGTAPCT